MPGLESNRRSILSPRRRGNSPHPPTPSSRRLGTGSKVEGGQSTVLSFAPLRLCGLIFFIALIFFPIISFAQDADAALSKFFAIQRDDEILLRWTIRAGNTCEDTYVERSLDGEQFKRIGLIGGICGSPDNPITYEFYDTAPAPNRINYYRLELGYYGYTSPQQAEFIVLNEQGYSLQQNPMKDKTTIVFQNGTDDEYRFILHDMNGRRVMDFTTTSDRITLYRQELGSGLHIFTLEGKDKILRGKLIVAD